MSEDTPNVAMEQDVTDIISDEPSLESVDGGESTAEDTPPAEASPAAVVPSSAPVVDGPPVDGGAPLVAPSASVPGAPPPEPLSREQELERDNALLRGEILKFSNKFMGLEPRPTGQQPVAVRPGAAGGAQRQPQLLNFIKDEGMFDETMKNAENMNALLTVVVQTAVEQAQRVVPALVSHMVNHQVTMKTAATEFYRKNEDLLPHRSFVGFIANEVTAKHPDWDLEKVLGETEKVSRERLILKSAAGGSAPGAVPSGSPASVPGGRQPSNSPAFVPRGGGRRGPNDGSNITPVEKEISDLISDFL